MPLSETIKVILSCAILSLSWGAGYYGLLFTYNLAAQPITADAKSKVFFLSHSTGSACKTVDHGRLAG